MPQKRKDDVSRNKKQALQGKAKKRGGRHDDDSDSVDSHGNIRGLIDYEYDKIDHMDYQKKVDLCIKNNSHILKHNNFYDNPEIDERLEYNKKHYNVWVENKILNFESNIEEKLKLFV